jgi:hypothetical protein
MVNEHCDFATFRKDGAGQFIRSHPQRAPEHRTCSNFDQMKINLPFRMLSAIQFWKDYFCIRYAHKNQRLLSVGVSSQATRQIIV